jgi:hypothetical protein
MNKASLKGTFYYVTDVLVGEIFYCGKETTGSLKVLPVYLGTAVSGFGGGFD